MRKMRKYKTTLKNDNEIITAEAEKAALFFAEHNKIRA